MKKVTEARYFEGFLVGGEPMSHKRCKVTGKLAPAYKPFIRFVGLTTNSTRAAIRGRSLSFGTQ